jgi:hypothetical protein
MAMEVKMFKQLTVFLENKKGRMEEVTGCLAKNGINLHALSIADTTDFGILRMIVSNPDHALCMLRENGFMVKTTDVIAFSIGHTPGSLHRVLSILKEIDVSIQYMYAFTSRHTDYDAIVILRLEEQDTALKALSSCSDIPLLSDELLDELNTMNY